MISVKLFTKSGCGLCDEVKLSLNNLQENYPHELIEVDISKDGSLFQKYRLSIPIVYIGDLELAAPITAVQLKQALQNQ